MQCVLNWRRLSTSTAMIMLLAAVAPASAQNAGCPCAADGGAGGAYAGGPYAGGNAGFGAPLPMAQGGGYGGPALGGGYAGDPYCSNDVLWKAKAEALYLHRSRADDNIFLRNDNAAGTAVLSGRDYYLGWWTGPAISLERSFDTFSMEAKFAMVDGWDDEIFVQNTGGLLYTPLSPGLFFTEMNTVYESQWYNGELNAKWDLFHPIRFLAGVRHMELDEQFTGFATLLNFFNMGEFDMRTNNFLYGGQIGVEGEGLEMLGVKVGFFLKAGLYCNHARAFFDNSITAFNFEQTDSRAAFVGEVGVNLGYALTSNVTVFGGYQWTWIDGVALAPDTLAQAELSLDTVLLQGARAGVEVVW